MITGYTRRLYILPFDHRASYISGLFGWNEPLNGEQMVTVANSKQVIYEFEFAYGEDFAQHLEAFHPTFAKVLVRYNPEGDAALNQRQADRLKRLSDYLRRTQTLFMFELLVPAQPGQLGQVEGDKNAYDLQIRPHLMAQTIQALQDAGVERDVWKVEGLDRQEDAVKVVEVARRGGRDTVGLIVLGRGAERDRVIHWLKTAARVPGFIGFAVGRTSFWQPLVDVEAKRISQEEAATQIADNFEAWIQIFEEARGT